MAGFNIFFVSGPNFRKVHTVYYVRLLCLSNLNLGLLAIVLAKVILPFHPYLRKSVVQNSLNRFYLVKWSNLSVESKLNLSTP